jgi:hypothetical protein
MPDAIDRLHSSPRPTKNLNLFANAKSSQKAKSAAPSVEPFDFEADLDCGRVFAPDEAYTTGIIEKKGRWTMEDEDQMLQGKKMECGEIKARNGFKEMQEWRSQQKVREMPLAFARIVHKVCWPFSHTQLICPSQIRIICSWRRNCSPIGVPRIGTATRWMPKVRRHFVPK